MAQPTIPDALIRRVARWDIPLADLRRNCEAGFTLPAGASTKQAVKILVGYAQEQKSRSQFGRFGAAIVFGAAVVGHSFIDQVNVSRLLVVEGRAPRFESALADFSDRLAKTDDPIFQRLRERFQTYATLYQLRLALEKKFADAIAALERRPFPFGKTLLATVNRAFLRHYFQFTHSPDLDDTYRAFHTAEDVAAAASAVIALANEKRRLESMDFSLPAAGLGPSELFGQVLGYGRAVSTLADAEKHISILDYRLSVLQARGPMVFELTPPLSEIEYAIRLGFVRGQIGQSSSRLQVARDAKVPYSVFAAVDKLLETFGETLFEITDRNTPFRRLLLKVPLFPQLFQEMTRWRFYEDVLMDERLAQELELPLQFEGDDAWELAPGLDIHTFQRIWRAVSFLNLLDVAMLRRHQDDSRLISNSLSRVISREKSVQILTMCGVTEAQASAFLELVSANVSRLGHYDMQYRPFLALEPSTVTLNNRTITAPAEVSHAPAVVALANVVPNLQRAHSIRVKANARALVAVAAEHLKLVLPRTKINASVKNKVRSTDVDIVALSDETLYLFECKHSITPTGAHEYRDLWGDINKGVSQLETAIDILRERLPDYVAGWFPGTNRHAAARLKMRPCVLCSHRVFSGLTIRGIPVRDHASFSLILGDATVHMGLSEDGEQVTLKRYRLRTSADPTLADLDNYLSEDAVFFEMFQPFMQQFTGVERLSEFVTLAREDYVYRFNGEDWAQHLDKLGAVRIADETLKLGPTPPPEAERAD